jgi:hypothetical protein
MTVSDLPHLTVTGINRKCCTIHYDASLWVDENWPGCLYLGTGRFIWGRFRDVKATERICSFYPDKAKEMTVLKPGARYRFLDGYWGQRAELVLKEGRCWERVLFEPSDMVCFPMKEGGLMGTRLSKDAPAGGEVVPGGWDHEHCDICWQTIGPGGEPYGFLSKPDKWVCEECYTNFVIPRSLAFITYQRWLPFD